MVNIKASIEVNGKPLYSNGNIPLLKSPQSGGAYDLFYSVAQFFKGKYTPKEIELEKRYRDFNYPNARPDTLRSAFTKTSKGANWVTESDVRKMNSEMNDIEYRLSMTINLIVDGTIKASVFDFHRCWTCNAEANLVDKVRMETFCCQACHDLHLAALPTSATTMPPPNEEDFWKGPFDVYVPRDLNDVPARDGRNRRYQNGEETTMFYPPMTEEKWKAKYAYERGGYWFFRV